jgi:pimeloyl-ACP methyl ester carboxylesterase
MGIALLPWMPGLGRAPMRTDWRQPATSRTYLSIGDGAARAWKDHLISPEIPMETVLDRSRSGLEGFERMELDLNGIRTVVHAGGQGEPVIYLHGAGTFTGFGYLRPWLASHRVIIPYHPGFGESADDAGIDSMQDYVLHNLDLFDALGLDRFSLVGHSFGGWMAAETALVLGARLRRLALVAPAGLSRQGLAATDLMTLPASKVLEHLTARPERITPFLPSAPDLDFLTLRYRERTAVARVTWERPSNPKLIRWLHRIQAPTLICWGGADRIRSAAHAELWAGALPNAKIRLYPGAGHLLLEEEDRTAAEISGFLQEQD